MIDGARIEPAGWQNEPRWTGGAWGLAVAVVFVAQLTLILFLGKGGQNRADPPPMAPPIQLLARTISQQELLDDFRAQDPLLFVSPSRHGFSGAGWLKIGKTPIQFPDLDEPPEYLSLQEQRLGKSLAMLLEAAGTNRFDLAVRTDPQPGPLELLPPPDTFGTQSVFRIEGVASNRLVGFPAPLPSWAFPGILRESIVEIGVNGAGDVLTARLLGRSGLGPADQWATGAARALRFSPVNQGMAATNLVRDRIVFKWHTVPPKETNGLQKALP